MASTDNIDESKKGSILIVDDELAYLKILKKILEKHYDVKTAESGEDGLKVLESGFSPGVIVSDQRMPGMSGAEFLKATMKVVPNATRIILTGYSNPKEIIDSINEGHAYIFLTKPTEDIAFLQSIKVAIDHYNSKKQNKKLVIELQEKVNELNRYNERLKNLVSENTTLFKQSVYAISGILNTSEKYYFTPHAKSVSEISKVIAQEMGMDEESKSLISMSSMLQGTVLVGMPQKYLLLDPWEFEDEEDRFLYFEHFNSAINVLQQVTLLSKHTRIINQIWEHSDGSGFPNALAGNQIFREAQILAIAKMYHNNTYRIPYSLINYFKQHGEIRQSKDATVRRHNDTIKLLYRKAAWFDFDVFHLFQEIVKKRSCLELVPDSRDLIIKSTDFFSVKKADFPGVNNKNKDTTEFGKNSLDNSNNIIENTKTVPTKDIEIPVNKLKEGMMMGQSLVAQNGILVVRQDTVLDESLIKKIKMLEVAGLISKQVVITVEDK